MYLHQIELENIKGFRGRHLLNLQLSHGGYAGWTVFAGRNGAGKSTLLKAVALAVSGPLRAHTLMGGFAYWVRKEQGVGRVLVELVHESGQDRFVGGSGKSPKGYVDVALKWTTNAKGTDALERDETRSTGAARQSVDRGPWNDSPQGWFLAAYGPYRHLGPSTPEVVRMAQVPELARVVNLFSESATLSEAVEWLRELHLRALEKRDGAAAQRDGILRLLNDGLLPDGSEVRRVDADGLWIFRDGVEMPLDQVSDGYRTVAALVTDILRRLYDAYGSLTLRDSADGHVCCDLPGVVLIDEVDSHLHVSWQQRIGTWLTRHFPRIQFLVTTHSPFICQSASPGGLVRLPAPGEERQLEKVSEDTWRSVVNGGADAAVLTDLFGLEHAHSPASEKLRQDIAGLEVKVIRESATSDEVAHYNHLKSMLSASLSERADRKLRAVVANGG